MILLLHFFPILLFIFIFVGSGLYFTLTNMPNAFYQISPITAIIPALIAAWCIHRGNTNQKMNDFLDGVRHRDVITMCIVFLLAGAFSELTKDIGSVTAVVHCALSFIPEQFLLIGLFLVAAFVSTSIGTSMGTIATISPIAAAFVQEIGLNPLLTAGTVVGGAMFGDNLSIISDTTIAAVLSQEADARKKLILNSKLAFTAGLCTIVILATMQHNHVSDMIAHAYAPLLVTPYLFLILLALSGVNVFACLISAIFFAGTVGWIMHHQYNIISFSKSINNGFLSMHEIMVLSLLVGGLSNLIGTSFIKELTKKLFDWLNKKSARPRVAQLMIAFLVSIFDILLANNTIAIVFSGEIAREIAKKFSIPSHYSAAWLDIFSCIFQGIIPYGAQLLLIATIMKLSPLAIVPYVFYCYILGIISLAYIMLCPIPSTK